MDNKPSFGRELILPLLLGGLSVLGIGIVFVLGRLSDTRQPVEIPHTETPFRFLYLGTEPGLSTLTPEVTETSAPLETEEPLFPVVTFSSPTEIILLPTGQPSRTPTASPTIESILSKVDDTYFQLLYDGEWELINVADTYQNTLHVSFEVGNSVSFTFAGQQVIYSYQSGPSLGRISINLDGIQFEIDQSSSITQLVNWQSGLLVRGTHTIIITHISGGSVNIDSIAIPNVSTPTPISKLPDAINSMPNL